MRTAHLRRIPACVYDVLGAFTPIAAPTREELEVLCKSIAERVAKLLERRATEEPEERTLCLALARSAAKLKARVDGFDLEATTVVRAEARARRARLAPLALRALLRAAASASNISAATSCAPHWPTDACACCPPSRWPWS